jgi:hypothetical protein
MPRGGPCLCGDPECSNCFPGRRRSGNDDELFPRNGTARAIYEVISASDTLIVIEDLNGKVSVTNDAEAVVSDLIQWKGGFSKEGKPKEIHYYDSVGKLSQLCTDGKKFTGFVAVQKEGPRT